MGGRPLSITACYCQFHIAEHVSETNSISEDRYWIMKMRTRNMIRKKYDRNMIFCSWGTYRDHSRHYGPGPGSEYHGSDATNLCVNAPSEV